MTTKKQKRKRRLRCDRCHQLKDDVSWCNDPYTEDIHGKKIKVRLCEDCYQESCNDI